MTDLDQGGQYFQLVRVYLGPSLGWREVQVRPSLPITAAGTYALSAGTSVVLVNVAGLVTINLPDVRLWMAENFNQPSTGFERAIWIKDLGRNASAFNITVNPFGTQKIDTLQQAFTIVQNGQLLRLYPINDLSGWFSG